jgi:hypothetical protein
MHKQIKSLAAVFFALAPGIPFGVPAAPPSDWSKVPTRTVTLFYPAQSSYEWIKKIPRLKTGEKIVRGVACVYCHEDEEADLGARAMKREDIEPVSLPDKNPAIELAVQAAYDDQNLYWRFQWRTKNPSPGIAYPVYRYDGKEWKPYGKPRLDKAAQQGREPAIYEDRLSIMLDDGKVHFFREHGCWLVCHNGMRDMPGAATREQVQAHELLGKVLKKNDVRKYLPSTRTDQDASWDKTRSPEEIAQLKADGVFLDLMQWRAHRSNPVGMADDGYVLEYRNFDGGKNMFASNLDVEKKQPKFMFDTARTGARALAAESLRDPGKVRFLVRGQNAVPFDPNAGWKEGDMLPQYYLSREDASGSAADNRDVKGEWKDGEWTVVWTRPLDTGHPEDDKILTEGGVYTVGFAVHDDNITARGHHVSFPVTLGIGARANIRAVKLK